MQLHPMISTEVQSHTSPVENPLLAQLSLVESQLLALQDVSIDTSTLSRSRRNDSQKTTGLELLLQSCLNLSLRSQSISLLLLYTLALLLRLVGGSLLLASSAEVGSVVGLIPLSERGSINVDNGRLGEGVGSDEFVVGRMESDDNHTDFAGNALRSPREVAGFETESTELSVATTGTDEMDSLGSDTGVGFLSAGFESALLPCKNSQFSGRNTCLRTCGLSTTHGNMHAWRQRQSACVCCHEKYP